MKVYSIFTVEYQPVRRLKNKPKNSGLFMHLSLFSCWLLKIFYHGTQYHQAVLLRNHLHCRGVYSAIRVL